MEADRADRAAGGRSRSFWRVVAPEGRTGPLGATALAGAQARTACRSASVEGWLSTTLKT
jgi:hypothetical protein